MSAQPKSKRGTPPRGIAPGDTKPSRPDAPVVQFRHGKPVLTVAERIDTAEDRIDGLIGDVRELSAAHASHARETRQALERVEAATLRHAAELSDLRASVHDVSRALGADYDPRASLHDMTAEELARVEAAGLRGQMRAVMATLTATKRTSGLAAGIGGVLSLEMMIRILLEILR